MAIDIDVIQRAIESAGASWRAAETSMTPLDDRLHQLRCGYTPGPNEPSLAEREQLALANLEGHRQWAAQAARTRATPEVDWRNMSGLSYVTPVKDQGQCGSCVAFGTAQTIDAAMRITQNVPVNGADAGTLQDLSEAQLFFCGGGQLCGVGWYPDAAFAYATSTGLVPESVYPYSAHDQACAMPNDWQPLVTRLSGHHVLSTVADMKSWLNTKGPLGACFTVYQDFMAYAGGVYTHTSGNQVGGHCICIIGYNEDLQAWHCKNQWGTAWGEGGYFFIGYGQCGIDSTMWAVDSFAGVYSAVPAVDTSVGGFAVYGSASRVYSIGAEQHLHELAYINGVWRQSDLTALAAGAPRAQAPSSISGFALNGTDSRVYYITPDNHIHELWYGGGAWGNNDLTAITGAPPAAPGGSLASFGVNGSAPRVYFVSDDGHVRELWWQNGWNAGDLTAQTNCPAASPATAICCFGVGGSASRVYYFTPDGHVNELYYENGWGRGDLTAQTGGPAAVIGTHLTAYGYQGSNSRVYFQSADWHVHELAWGPGWGCGDVTAAANCSPAAAFTNLVCYGVGSTNPRVYYLTPDNHMNELYWEGNWGHNDLTGMLTG